MKTKTERVVECVNIRKDILNQNLQQEEKIQKIYTALSDFVNTGVSSTTKIKLSNGATLQLNCSNKQQSGITVFM